MSRADLLWQVLKDGKPHTRREIFEQVGYMLTNNAASELRARGLNVIHTRQGRVDSYEITGSLREPAEHAGDTPQSRPEPTAGSSAGSRSEAMPDRDQSLGPLQLSLEEAA